MCWQNCTRWINMWDLRASRNRQRVLCTPICNIVLRMHVRSCIWKLRLSYRDGTTWLTCVWSPIRIASQLSRFYHWNPYKRVSFDSSIVLTVNSNQQPSLPRGRSSFEPHSHTASKLYLDHSSKLAALMSTIWLINILSNLVAHLITRN